jgi:hypothetical protein
MSVNVYFTRNYENNPALRLRKNKPNSKPIQTQTKPICSEAKMGVNICFTRNYVNNPAMRLPQNKPKTNPIKLVLSNVEWTQSPREPK